MLAPSMKQIQRRRVRIDVLVEESNELNQRLCKLQMVLCKSHVNAKKCIHCWEASDCLATENQACKQRLSGHANCDGERDHMFLILAELGLASQDEVDLTADHPVEGRVRVLGLEDLLAFTCGFLICLLLLFLDVRRKEKWIMSCFHSKPKMKIQILDGIRK